MHSDFASRSLIISKGSSAVTKMLTAFNIASSPQFWTKSIPRTGFLSAESLNGITIKNFYNLGVNGKFEFELHC